MKNNYCEKVFLLKNFGVYGMYVQRRIAKENLATYAHSILSLIGFKFLCCRDESFLKVIQSCFMMKLLP